MRPDPLLQIRRLSLDPAEDGGVCDLDAAVLQIEREGSLMFIAFRAEAR